MKNLFKILPFTAILVMVGCTDEIVTTSQRTYHLEVTPESYSFPEEGDTIEFTVTATKTVSTLSEGTITDTTTLEVPYSVTMIDGEGFILEGNKIIALPNEDPTPRKALVTITIEEAEAFIKTILLTQEAKGDVSVSYSLEVAPETLIFSYNGGSLSVSVIATKTTTVSREGEIVSEITEDTPYTLAVEGEGFSLNDNMITTTENSLGEKRSGTLTVALVEDTLSKFVALRQGVYPPSSYTVDGTALTKWNGPETIVDLSIDPFFEPVTNIANRAFDATAVETITISKNITTIGDQAFYPTSVLREFQVEEGNSIFFAIDGVLFSYGTGNFEGFTYLHRFPQGKPTERYQMPEVINRLGNYSFAYLRNMTSLTVIEGVSHINYRAFYGCTNLSLLTLPSTIENIGNNVFQGVNKLTKVYVKATTPPFIGANGNWGANVANTTLYVPIGSKAAYSADAQWGKFGTIEEMEF